MRGPALFRGPAVQARSPEDRKSKLRLDANENLWGPAPAVLRALRALARADLAVYPDARPLTRAAARRFGVATENIVLTNGADEAIYAAVAVLAGPGDRIVMPVPGFEIFAVAAGLRGARIEGVPLGPDFAFSRTSVLKAIGAGTRLIVLVTPNNPTGTVIPREDVASVAAAAAARGISVLIDETYSGFQNRSHAALLRRFPNCLVIGSFSKYHALAGLRLGYAVARADLISGLRAFLPPYSVNAAALAAGRAALGARAYYRRAGRAIVAERKALFRGLEETGLKVFPSGGNFVCVRIGPQAPRLRDALAAEGILVRDFRNRDGLSDCLRINAARPAGRERLLKAVRAALLPEALLFDMDGVLVDVSASYRRAIAETASFFLGVRVAPADVDRVKRRPGMNNDWDAAAALLRSRGVRVPRAELIDVFQKIHGGDGGRPGLAAAERWLLPKPSLTRLARRYALGIVTGRPREEALSALRRFGTESFFRAVVALEDVGRRTKPDALGLRLALRGLGAGRAVYFGDSPDDMAAARAAGVRAVAVRPPGLRAPALWRARMEKAGSARVAPGLAAALEEYL